MVPTTLAPLLSLLTALSIGAAPDDLDFRALLQPVPGQVRIVDGVRRVESPAALQDPDHFVWGGSVIEGEDGRFHMFYSRWDAGPDAPGMYDGWLLGSEIAYAVSDRPDRGFVFQRVLLTGRAEQGEPDTWDAQTVHNPHVRRFGDRVYLYYTGARDPGQRASGEPGAALGARNRIQQVQKVGVLAADSVADLVAGRFTRSATPLLEPRTRVKPDPVIDPSPAGTIAKPDNLIVVNPSVVRRPADGKYLLYFKGNFYDGGWRACHGVAEGDSPTGPFTARDEFLFHVEGKDGGTLNAEDPFVWVDPDRARFYALLKDFTGGITGGEPGLALFTSLDGVDWGLAAHPRAMPRSLLFASGQVLSLRHVERPQILRDAAGRPRVLYVACRIGDGDAHDGAAFNVQIPLHSSAPRPRGEGTPRPGRRAPNVVLLMSDQHRGDALGCDGNAVVRTPNLDRLAREGCRFRRAYSSTPSCTPARAAILTGRSPWGHGMLGYYRVAARYPVELPRVMAAAGYHTHAIGKNHFHPQRNAHGYGGSELDESGRVESPGFVSDYRAWFARKAPGLDPDATGLGWNDYRAGVYALPEDLHPTRWTGDCAVRFIREHGGDGPFFLKVSFARPHSPYDPPRRLLHLYDDAAIPAPVVGAWAEEANGSIHRPNAHSAARNDLGVETARRSRAAYFANVTFIDEQIGRILAALEETGELARTVILYTADHGDMLGDHHLWRKTYAYEGSARIPMILWWGEDAMGLRRGQVRGEPVELRDVLPTLAEAAGAPRVPGVEGRSLFDLVRGQGGWREILDLEHATCYWEDNVWTALTDGRHKYVYFARSGAQQLFDLEADPGETVNLAADPSCADLVARWRGRMMEHLAPRGAPWVVDGDLGRRNRKILIGANYPW